MDINGAVNRCASSARPGRFRPMTQNSTSVVAAARAFRFWIFGILEDMVAAELRRCYQGWRGVPDVGEIDGVC